MFLHVSVILSTGEGGAIPACLAAGLQGRGLYPSMPCRFPGPHPGGGSWGRSGQGVSRPTPKGKLRGIWPGGSPGPHPRGKLRGIWPGGCLQAHTQRVSRPTPGGGLSQHALRQTPPNGCCCGWYASYWNAFLLSFLWHWQLILTAYSAFLTHFTPKNWLIKSNFSTKSGRCSPWLITT